MKTDTLTPAARIALLAVSDNSPFNKPDEHFILVDRENFEIVRDLASAATTAAQNQGKNVSYWVAARYDDCGRTVTTPYKLIHDASWVGKKVRAVRDDVAKFFIEGAVGTVLEWDGNAEGLVYVAWDTGYIGKGSPEAWADEGDVEFIEPDPNDPTPEQIATYLANSSLCPCCGSDDIEGDNIEADDSGTWQKIECHHCGAVWNDVCKLVGYEILVPPSRPSFQSEE